MVQWVLLCGLLCRLDWELEVGFRDRRLRVPRLVDQDRPDVGHVGRSINGCEEVRDSTVVNVKN